MPMLGGNEPDDDAPLDLAALAASQSAPAPAPAGSTSDDDPLDLAALAALAVQALDENPPEPYQPPPEVPTRGRSDDDRYRRDDPYLKRRNDPEHVVRTRTLPPDAPLDVIDLSQLVPNAMALDDEIMSEGVIEIPIELDDLDMVPDIGEAGERALQQTPLLSSLGPDAMQQLINDVELVELQPGEIVFMEGDEGQTLYVIADGAVSVFSEGPPRRKLSTLQEGDFFGEIAIVTNQVRSATVEADIERGASVLAIDRNVIGNLVDEEPSVLKALLRFLRGRLVNRLIQTSPLFAPFTGRDARGLAGKFRFLEVSPNSVIVEQDKRASGLCIMLAGTASVIRKEDGEVRRIGQLAPGDICGETSLLANEPAPFTIRAQSKSFILQLPGSVFREVIMTHPQVLVFISDLAEERHRQYSAVAAGNAGFDSKSIKLF